jgi:gliding motility-associated-like protein
MRQYLLLICTCFAFFLQVNTYAQQTVAHGQTTAKFALPAGGCAFKYNWTNDHPEIGLPAFGSGDVPAFVAVNNTNSAITANIKVEAAGLAYIGSAFNSVVNVTDLSTFENFLSIDMGSGNTASYQITSKDGKRVYILSYNSRKLISINTADDARTIVDLGTAPPNYLALSADGSRLYVSINNAGEIKVFNTADLSLIHTILIPVPGNMVVSPDDSRLYVIGLNAIHEVNTTTNTYPVVSHPMSPKPSSIGMTISADGKEIYMTTYTDNVAVFNTVTKTVTDLIPTMGSNAVDFAFSSDGNTLYVANLVSRNISVIDTRTKSLRSTFNVPYNPNGLDVSATGSRLFVVSPGENRIYIYNTADQQYIGSFSSGASPTGISSFIVQGSCPTANYTVTVTPPAPPPDIKTTGSPIAVNTTYGTPSANTGFNISATDLSAGIQIVAPVGFEVSIDNSNFNGSLLIPHNSGVANAQVYVRLAAYAKAGPHKGNITINTAGATEKLVSIPNSIVAKAPLTIVLNNIEKTYGQTLSNVTATTGFSAAVLQNGETITAVNMVYGAGAAATDPVATYPGTVDCNSPTGPNFDAGNYDDPITQPGDIVVNKAELTVTADDKSRVFGMPDPVFTYSFSGFVNNETQAQLIVRPVATTVADAAAPAGEYAINVSGAEADNYSFKYVAGTFTIQPLVPPDLIIPNTFTPNADGINDRWVIKNIENAPNCIVDIFNRAGQKVFTSIGYGASWDGSYKNINAPVGAYYYIIDPRNGEAKLSGTVTLIR